MGFMATEQSDEDLVPTFIPPLIAILTASEQERGAPLTEDEVVEIRDNAVAMMMPRSMGDAMAASRGYADLDPENVWAEWQLRRTEVDGTDT